MKPSITDTFNKELNAAMFDSGVLGVDESKSKKEFEIKEDGERRNYKPLEFLKDGDSLSEILSLVKNKKISKNKIRAGIKKLLKNPEDLNNFLQSILDGRTKKEESKEASVSGAGVGMFLGPLSGEEPKKVETKEAAVSGGGVGAYETPKAWAKSTSKKDWRGKSKTQIPGGTFVQVKKKCKSFPYCNQG